MSHLIIALYGSQTAAFVAGESLATLQREAGVEPEDIVVVTRDSQGRVSLNQSIDLATGAPLGGGQWGVLTGMMFLDARKPTGKSKGLAEQLHAAGLTADFLAEACSGLTERGAAVGLRVRMLGVDPVLDRLRGLKGDPRILLTRLAPETEEALVDLQQQIPPSALGEADGLI